MNNIPDELSQLESAGWNIHKNPSPARNKQIWLLSNPPEFEPCYTFSKDFGNLDGVLVVVTIHPKEETYQVYSSSEHRVSGPIEDFHGSFANEEDAFQKGLEICQFWDKN